MLNKDLLFQINLTDSFTANGLLYIGEKCRNKKNLFSVHRNSQKSNNLFTGDKNVSEWCRRVDKSLKLLKSEDKVISLCWLNLLDYWCDYAFFSLFGFVLFTESLSCWVVFLLFTTVWKNIYGFIFQWELIKWSVLVRWQQ